MSMNSINPSTLFGGTWEQIKDTFLLASGSSYEAGTIGGEATHTLTTTEMPSHSHTNCIYNTNNSNSTMAISAIRLTNGVGAYSWINISTASDITTAGGNGGDPCGITKNTGGSQAHNNMPPYLAVYKWKSIS